MQFDTTQDFPNKVILTLEFDFFKNIDKFFLIKLKLLVYMDRQYTGIYLEVYVIRITCTFYY